MRRIDEPSDDYLSNYDSHMDRTDLTGFSALLGESLSSRVDLLERLLRGLTIHQSERPMSPGTCAGDGEDLRGR
jgi:hypothetical protein